jgi:hypothetical protein
VTLVPVQLPRRRCKALIPLLEAQPRAARHRKFRNAGLRLTPLENSDAEQLCRRSARLWALRRKLKNGNLTVKWRDPDYSSRLELFYRAQARSLYRRIERYVTQQEAAGSIVTWNGMLGAGAMAAQAAQGSGRGCYFLELSPFRGRLFYDPEGVNFRASLMAWRFEKTEADPQRGEAILTAFRCAYRGRTSARAGATILSELREADLPTPFLFAPLQVPYDTQILLGGGAFASDLDYLDWLRRFAQVLPAPYQLVIKPHPQHSYAPGVLEHFFQAAPQARVLRGVETRALIEQAEAIVTLNSTVGFDALCFEKPVLLLGQALYGQRQLVSFGDPDAPEVTAEAIDKVAPPHKEALQQFVADYHDRHSFALTPEAIEETFTA